MKRTFLLLILLQASQLHAGWFQQTSGTTVILHSVMFDHSTDGIAWTCGDNGVILKTTNGGATWIQKPSGTTAKLYCICFMEIMGAPVMSVGENGTILRSTDQGETWVTIPSPTTNTLRDISDFNFIAVGDNGTILKSSNNGLTFSQMISPTTKRLNAVAGVFTVNAVGDSGTHIRGFSTGMNWTVVNNGSAENLYGLPMFSGLEIAVGDHGSILRSTTGGASWFSAPSNTSNRLNSMEYSVNNISRIYVAGNNGTILKSTTNGTNWGSQISPVNTNLNSVFFYLNDNTGYICGDNGVILKTTDGGGTIFTGISQSSNQEPESFSLGQNYPNPFNPETKIRFNIPVASDLRSDNVTLRIYDALGREIETLVNENLKPGGYEVSWNASAYPSGVYFYRLVVGDNTNNGGYDYSVAKKMVLVK